MSIIKAYTNEDGAFAEYSFGVSEPGTSTVEQDADSAYTGSRGLHFTYNDGNKAFVKDAWSQAIGNGETWYFGFAFKLLSSNGGVPAYFMAAQDLGDLSLVRFYLSTNDKVYANLYSTPTATITTGQSEPLDDGQWHTLVIRFKHETNAFANDGELEAYVDGVSLGSSTNLDTAAFGDATWWVTLGNGSASSMNGAEFYLDPFRIATTMEDAIPSLFNPAWASRANFSAMQGVIYA